MWLRTDSLAFRAFSASRLISFSGGQPSRSGFGKSHAKCFRPMFSNSFSEMLFCCLFCFFMALCNAYPPYTERGESHELSLKNRPPVLHERFFLSLYRDRLSQFPHANRA